MLRRWLTLFWLVLPLAACKGGVADPGTLVVLTHAPSGEVRFVQFGSGQIAERITVGGEPSAMVRDPVRGRVYVLDRADDSVIAIDVVGRRLLSRAAVGETPHALILSPDGRRLFVTGGGNTLAILDAEAMQVTNRVPVGGGPGGIAVSADGSRVYVALPNDRSIAVVDAVTGRRATRPIPVVVGLAGPLALATDGGTLVSATAAGGSLQSIRITGRETTELSAGAFAQPDLRVRSVMPTPDGRNWLVTRVGSRDLLVLSTDGSEPRRIALTQDAAEIAIAPGGRVLVSSPDSDAMLEVDLDSGKVTRRIRIGGGHESVAVFSRATLEQLRSSAP